MKTGTRSRAVARIVMMVYMRMLKRECESSVISSLPDFSRCSLVRKTYR